MIIKPIESVTLPDGTVVSGAEYTREKPSDVELLAQFCESRIGAIIGDNTALPKSLSEQKYGLLSGFASAFTKMSNIVGSYNFSQDEIGEKTTQLFTNYAMEIIKFDRECADTIGREIGINSTDKHSPYDFLPASLIESLGGKTFSSLASAVESASKVETAAEDRPKSGNIQYGFVSGKSVDAGKSAVSAPSFG